MTTFRNIFACLVHENRDCVADLVQNLHQLDPGSTILLYNGSGDPGLLVGSGFPFERYGAVIHPTARPMRWGYLHGFAVDSLRWAAGNGPFDALTIVDSDQLALRAGYSERIAAFLAGRPRLGLIGSAPPPQGALALPQSAPARDALKERDLWRPFLRRFPDGEAKFPHWTFWPSTVFTAAAGRALVDLWDGDQQLRGIMERSKIWATEEVVLPTLVALLGFEVAQGPACPDYVKYRVGFTLPQLARALQHPDAYWMHPVPRAYDHPLRRRIRERHADYGAAVGPAVAGGLFRAGPVLSEIRSIEGWLSEAEADLLIAGATRAVRELPEGSALVEIGSYCGKATVALGRVVAALSAAGRVYAIDPHDGLLGARDRGLVRVAPSLDKLRLNLERAHLSDRVEVVALKAADVAWQAPVGFLLVDGLHDYAAVAADFQHFEPHLVDGALVAFHDYADYFPGVKSFVNHLIAGGRYQEVDRAESLVLLVKRAAAPASVTLAPAAPAPRIEAAAPVPLVTCIMPTADRRHFVAHAIRHFLAQGHPRRELVIVDDGADSVADLVPADTRIRYLRLSARATVGKKRNLACAAAAGEIIVHFDDDDWSAPARLDYQVAELLRSGAAVNGLGRLYYHQPASGRCWEYAYPQGRRKWISGNTLCYLRRTWQAAPFAEIDVGEDARFLWSAAARAVQVLERRDFFVAMVHERNVDPKRTTGRFWRPVPAESVRALMGQEELTRYRDSTVAAAARPPGGTWRSSA